jgi:hypothetical protein
MIPLRRLVGGLLTVCLLVPVPVFAWTMSGSWFVADGTTPVNATFSDSYADGTDTLKVFYSPPGGAEAGRQTKPVSIVLWRGIGWDTNPDRIQGAFTDNKNVDLSPPTGTTLAASAQIGFLSGTAPKRTFGNATTIFSDQWSTGNGNDHKTSGTAFGTTQTYIQVTLTISPSPWTLDSPTTPVGTFTFTQ